MRRLKGVAAAAGIVLATMSFAAPTTADEIQLRIGSGHPIGLLVYTKVAHEFLAPELERRLEAAGHDVTVQELHAGQVAKVTEVLETTRDGLLDIGLWATVFEPTDAFLQNWPYYIPFNSSDPYQVTMAIRQTFERFPELLDVYEEEHNQKILATSCIANYGLGTNFEWTTFEDLEGHKIAGAGANLRWIEGATPVASNLNEAYQAIETGVYEGYISSALWWKTFKLYEVAKYFTEVNFGVMGSAMLAINKGTWERLPADAQEILIKLGRDYELMSAIECANFNRTGLSELRKLDVNVKEIDEAAQARWCEAVSSYPNEMAKEADSRDLPGTEVIGYYMDTLKGMGYEFPCEMEIASE